MNSPRLASTLVSGLFASALAICMVASQPAIAQDNTIVAKADIPFAFQAGSQVMPAGTYIITSQSDHVLLLRGPNQKAEEFVMVETEYALHAPKDSVIVFDHRADQYFLRHIWTANNNTGLECPKGKAERRLEVASAKTPMPSDTVTLALNTAPRR